LFCALAFGFGFLFCALAFGFGFFVLAFVLFVFV